jgi:tRNA dimethylallyltransferase
MELIPLVVILGPTAVGKTDLSILLAERLGGEIVSADSRLFYRGMDIGTAKPSIEARARMPHHLIDVADPDEVWSLAKFQDAANDAILDIHSRGRLPMLVGGTGQYLRAVIEGWDIPRTKPDKHLRKALNDWAEQIGAHELHYRLTILDPQAAAKIDPRNVRRTVRALEVIFHTGKLFSEQRSVRQSPYDALVVGLTRDREELYQRVDTRIQDMLASGFVAEVSDLLSQGYSPSLATLSAIGYREIVAYLQGEISLDEAQERMKRQTRVFIRRQANWFKPDDPNIHWFDASRQPIDAIETLIQNWLESFSGDGASPY